MIVRNERKPVLYWITLAIMLVAFVGVAMSAKGEFPGRVDDTRAKIMDINVAEWVSSYAGEASFCPWKTGLLERGES